jgi:hypothetical protein
MGRAGLGGRCVSEVVTESVIVSVDSLLSTLFTLLALSVEVSLAVDPDGVVHISPTPSPADRLAFPLPFSVALVVLFETGTSLGNTGTGGLPIDSRFSTALAAAAFPAAARLVIDTAETLDLTEAVEVGRLGTGGSLFVSPLLGRDAVLILVMDEAIDAVDAVDVRRGRAWLSSVVCGPTVGLEALEVTDPRRVLTSDFAVWNTVDTSLLVDVAETGLTSSFLVDNFEFGRAAAFEGPAVATGLVLRIVEACERTEAATDFGRSEGVTLLAVLLLLDTVESLGLDIRDACDA